MSTEIAIQSVSSFQCDCCRANLSGRTNEIITCEGCDSQIKIVAIDTTMVVFRGKIKPRGNPVSVGAFAGALLGLIAIGVIQEIKKRHK